MHPVVEITILCSLIVAVQSSAVFKISDDELVHAVSENSFILAFLQPGGCETPECLYSISELNRVVEAGTIPGLRAFQVPHSAIGKKLSNNGDPRVVFYREAVPILYDDGLILRDEILTWMENNKNKHTTRLDSTNFEHLTQASTGATTGDWLVLFHKKGCEDLMPIWEAVASRLRHKLNVAEVDMSSSPALKTRFQLTRCPSTLFFRQGKIYSYELTVRDIESYVSFADGWYTNAPSRPVPVEPTPFDVFTDNIVSWLKDSVELLSALFSFWGIVTLTTVAIVLILSVRYVRRRSRKQKLF